MAFTSSVMTVALSGGTNDSLATITGASGQPLLYLIKSGTDTITLVNDGGFTPGTIYNPAGSSVVLIGRYASAVLFRYGTFWIVISSNSL
jgi:hypothetical protein